MLIQSASVALTTSVIAQAVVHIPVDFKGEAPSSNGCFIPNQGQLLDTEGRPATKVTAYSLQYYPQMFIEKDNTLSITLDTRDTIAETLDTIVKFEIRFIGEHLDPSSYITLHEPLPDKYNFVLGHLANPLLGLTSYRRVIYRDVYPFIDVHVYSNKWGPKLYMVMRPGADPMHLHMKFVGQDSLIMDALGYLKPYIEGRNIILPKGLCYQEIDGDLVLVNAQLGYQLDTGSAEVNFLPMSFNVNYPLIIDISAMGPDDTDDETIPPLWNTFYGHTASDWANDGTALPSGGLLVAGTTYSQFFPVFNAEIGPFAGSRMAYVSEFDAEYARIYTTLFGGNGGEDGSSVALSADGTSVYLFGKTNSTNLPLTDPGGGAFMDNSPQTQNCYIAQLSRMVTSAGMPEWVTYFGDGLGGCSCIRESSQGDLYILGSTFGMTAPNVQTTCDGTNGSFPMCNQLGPQAYQQSSNVGGGDVFLARFNAQHQLKHSTFFGGNASDLGTMLAIHPTNGRVYFTGQTSSPRLAYTNCQPPTSGSFPLCNLPGSYFQQDLNNGEPFVASDAFVAGLEINGSFFWSSFFGGGVFDVGHAITINPVSNQLYIGGQTTSFTGYGANNCQPSTGVGFPSCASGTQVQYPPGGYTDGFVARFVLSNHSLGWTTFLGREGFDKVSALHWDEGGNLWVAGSTDANSSGSGTLPLAELTGVYYQDVHGDGEQVSTGTDAMIFSFSPQDELRHGTYMGGVGNDEPNMMVAAISGQLYVAGSSMSTAGYPFACPPTTDPYCYLTYATMLSGTMEAFYTNLRHGVGVGLAENANAHDAGSPLLIFPNPGEGVFAVALPAELKGQFSLSVYDAIGRLRSVEFRAVGAHGALQPLDLQSVDAGMYMVRLRALDGTVERTGKLLVQ